MADSRQIALDILIAWDRDGQYPNLLLKEKLGVLSDVRDRSFCTGLVYGVVESKLKLDYLISSVSSTPFKKIHIVNKNVMRMGLYQILFMNVPISAACNTSVNLSKKNGQLRSAGFVNAILRKLASQKETLSFPDGNDPQSLSVRYSVDVSIVSLLKENFGVKFIEEYFGALSTLPSDRITLAVNLLKIDARSLSQRLVSEGVDVIERENDFLTVSCSLNISELASFKQGLYHVIGRPSFETAKKLDVMPGQTVLDLCSAPGGKTFALAYRMKNQGRIIAADVSPAKVDAMEKEARRLGITNVEFLCADGTKQIRNWIGIADRVLCDVPCSGLGIIGKKPDIRYKDLSRFDLMKDQRKILENGISYLNSSGMLVYSTCTINPAENHTVVSAFADRIIEEKTYLPQTDGTEGFYYALLKNNNDD